MKVTCEATTLASVIGSGTSVACPKRVFVRTEAHMRKFAGSGKVGGWGVSVILHD